MMLMVMITMASDRTTTVKYIITTITMWLLTLLLMLVMMMLMMNVAKALPIVMLIGRADKIMITIYETIVRPFTLFVTMVVRHIRRQGRYAMPILIFVVIANTPIVGSVWVIA